MSKKKIQKLRWRNIPLFFIKPLIQVGQMGEDKYGTFDFLTNENLTINDHLDSLKRHLEAFESPFESDNDHESGLNNMAHVAWRALAIIYVMTNKPHLDNRYKIENSKRKNKKSRNSSKKSSKTNS